MIPRLIQGNYPFAWATSFATFHAGNSIGFGQGENCLYLEFTRTSEDMIYFDRQPPLYISYTNRNEKRKRKMWKGNFEDMKCHRHHQNWDMMPVGDIGARRLRFKIVLLDVAEKFCPLARSKRLLAKPWLSNEREKAQILSSHFQAVFTRESPLPWAVLQSHSGNAKIEKVCIACNNEEN